MTESGVGVVEANDGNGDKIAASTVASIGTAPTPSPTSGNNNGNTPSSKAAMQQLQKMKDANTKYKNLLKMAKERIEQQEQELKTLREGSEKMSQEKTAVAATAAASGGMDGGGTEGNVNENNMTLVRVCQRIKVELEAYERMRVGGGSNDEEIWALLELEETPDEEVFGDAALGAVDTKRMKRWKKFDSETHLSDYIRRDSGEPLTLPPYSLTPQQSSRITSEAQKQVTQLTEEYRRFRVKSEMTRKQMDTQIRELQSTHVESAKRRIEGQKVEKELEVARTEHTQLERMRGEMVRQEAQWKESYDLLLKENEALKSSGSEALLASQWRQRYETCLKEKEEAENKYKMAEQRAAAMEGGGRGGDNQYEMKYRDLKESFRLYRKKAKEIFEAQQQNGSGGGTGAGGGGNATTPLSPNAMMMKISSDSSEESKLSYLKNLMVNYLTAEPEVRDHMEMAIGTVLQFTQDDVSRIKQKKDYDASWGLF